MQRGFHLHQLESISLKANHLRNIKMIEEVKGEDRIFPQVGNQFITRLIFTYIPHSQLYSKVSMLNKKAHQLAMDCSILKDIVYGKKRDNLSYDCYDWFEYFLARLTKREELRKLDFHYFYRGEQLSRKILKEMIHFYNLEDLRFGEHHFSNSNLNLFSKLKFLKCTHLTIPLYAVPDKAEEFFKVMKEVTPNVKSLTFEDPSFDRESSTERCATTLATLGIEHLKFKLHEKSTRQTMSKIISDLYPNLQTLYISCVQPSLQSHTEILEDLLNENYKLKKLKLKCDGSIPGYQIRFKINSLEDVYISRLTYDYSSLTQFFYMNQNLKRVKIKHPTKMEKVHDPRNFSMNSLAQLQYLNIAGEFKKIQLKNLPSLEYLQIKFQWARVKLITHQKLRMNLCELEANCDYSTKLIHVTKLNILWKNVRVAHFKQTECQQKFYFPCIEELRTSEPNLVSQMIYNPQLIRLTYLYPPLYDQYIEDFLENAQNIQNLRYLRIDGTLRTDKSLGQIKLSFPNLTTFCIRSVDKADDQIVITEDCKSLKDFQFLCTNNKKLRIEAPNIERILIDGLCDYKPEDLVITSMTAYTLTLSRGGVHIENCSGLGQLVIDSNWSNQSDYLSTELTTPNYFPYLTHISAKNLGVYSNEFFHSFAVTAPQLQEIYISFNEVLILQNEKGGDDIIEIKHPGVKWVTLLEGNTFFTGIKICNESKNLRLLKFRDFELEEFTNERQARFQSEKNLLNDKDF